MSKEVETLELEGYRTALLARNIEIQLFWQRSNYFLVLNTAIGTGFFAVRSDEFAYLLGCLGLASAVLWLLVNLGSKFWQSRWEERLHLTEQGLFPEEVDLFAADWDTIKKDVKSSLDRSFREAGRVGQLYAWGVLKKPSVTRLMTHLSCVFVVFWVMALVGLLVRDYT